jgi:hypothetical protein
MIDGGLCTYLCQNATYHLPCAIRRLNHFHDRKFDCHISIDPGTGGGPGTYIKTKGTLTYVLLPERRPSGFSGFENW